MSIALLPAILIVRRSLALFGHGLGDSDASTRPLNMGIKCYRLSDCSGVLATSPGGKLAPAGMMFTFSYERPFSDARLDVPAACTFIRGRNDL